jgi:ribosomal protein S28E/S33
MLFVGTGVDRGEGSDGSRAGNQAQRQGPCLDGHSRPGSVGDRKQVADHLPTNQAATALAGQEGDIRQRRCQLVGEIDSGRSIRPLVGHVDGIDEGIADGDRGRPRDADRKICLGGHGVQDGQATVERVRILNPPHHGRHVCQGAGPRGRHGDARGVP